MNKRCLTNLETLNSERLVSTEKFPALHTGNLAAAEGMVATTEFHPDEFRRQVESAFATLPDKLRQRMEQVVTQTLSEHMHTRANDSWHLYTLRDAFEERQPLQYVVEGLFALPSLNIVYGAPACMKSIWLEDLAVSVTAGYDWPDGVSPVKQPLTLSASSNRRTLASPVLWCDFDNGLRRTHERFEAIARARNIDPESPLYYVSMPRPRLDAGNLDSVSDLKNRITDLGAKLVIIDNLGLVSTNTDENASAMVSVMEHLRWLSEQTGSAVVVIHHQRKSGGQGASGVGDTLRGHSSILAAVDLALLVQRERGSKTITIEATKARDADVAPFGASFYFEHRPRSTELAVARFVGAAVDDTRSDWAVTKAILSVLAERHPLNQTNLIRAAKEVLPAIGHNRIADIIKQMAEMGELVSTSGQRGAVLYDLPEAVVVQHPTLTSALPE